MITTLGIHQCAHCDWSDFFWLSLTAALPMKKTWSLITQKLSHAWDTVNYCTLLLVHEWIHSVLCTKYWWIIVTSPPKEKKPFIQYVFYGPFWRRKKKIYIRLITLTRKKKQEHINYLPWVAIHSSKEDNVVSVQEGKKVTV